MNRQKLITVTERQVDDLKAGRYGLFIGNMISVGANTLKAGGAGQGEMIESIQGPYHDKAGAMLFVVNIKTIRSGD